MILDIVDCGGAKGAVPCDRIADFHQRGAVLHHPVSMPPPGLPLLFPE